MFSARTRARTCRISIATSSRSWRGKVVLVFGVGLVLVLLIPQKLSWQGFTGLPSLSEQFRMCQRTYSDFHLFHPALRWYKAYTLPCGRSLFPDTSAFRSSLNFFDPISKYFLSGIAIVAEVSEVFAKAGRRRSSSALCHILYSRACTGSFKL